MKIEGPTNLRLDTIKFECSKQFCPPSKIDFRSDEEWATEPASDIVTPILTYKIEY